MFLVDPGTRRVLRRLLVIAVLLALAAVALRLSPISVAALVPRTPTSWLIVGGVVAAILLVEPARRAGLTSRSWLRATLRAVPVLALVAVVLVPATVDREVSESLLEGIPAPSAGASTAPAAGAAPATTAPAESTAPPAAPAEPERLSGGEIVGVGHEATGEAVVYRAGETSFVPLQGIDIQGAVDVLVWLVPEPVRSRPTAG